ncbi:MAG: hypothetical protein ABH873_02715 [Candidatus Firestonebacteria bacterium]
MKQKKEDPSIQCFLKLVKRGFEIEAVFLILSTWNFAAFRYAVNRFNVNKYKNVHLKIRKLLKKMKNQDIRRMNLSLYKKEIIAAYNILARIKGK